MVTLVRVTRRAAACLADNLGVAAIALTGPLCVQIAFNHWRSAAEQLVQYDSHFSFAIKHMGSIVSALSDALADVCCARRVTILEERMGDLEANQRHAASLGLGACCLNPARVHVR